VTALVSVLSPTFIIYVHHKLYAKATEEEMEGRREGNEIGSLASQSPYNKGANFGDISAYFNFCLAHPIAG
jgi:hypothetical protein